VRVTLRLVLMNESRGSESAKSLIGRLPSSINDVGLHAVAANLARARADERSVPIIFKRNERDEQDHSSDPCLRCFSRSKLAGL
jgi:hypothetical protein